MTIKAYTDLPQSKILAEILPLESADMYYTLSEDNSMYMTCFGKPNNHHLGKIQICWSLASLIESITKVQQGGIFYNLTYDFILNKWTMNIEADNWREDVGLYDNPLDAVFEMILKLHKLNLL